MSDDAALPSWSELRSAGLVRRVAGGETVFREGDPADGAYVVLGGRCAVVEVDERVAVLGPGELFGEMGALGNGVRSATVLALEDAELLFLSLSQMRDGFVSSPNLFWQAMRLVVQRLGTITARQIAYREEHKALREVQRSLLPDLTRLGPDAPVGAEAVWVPCTYASGDYYDVIRLDAHRTLIAIGDVMGHGAESSLMMAVARAQVRELARSFRRTDEVLLNLDGYLRDNAPPRQGISLVVAVHDDRERTLEYSSAGHPFPLLLRGGEVSVLPGRPGVLLALPFLVGSGYERRELPVEPGDRLLFFTDGMCEVEVDEDGTQLGSPGLAQLLAEVAATAADGCLETLVARVAALDPSPTADDDRTALLVRIRPREP